MSELRRLTWCQNLTEAEMIAAFLLEEGIRVLVRRAPGVDVRDFPAAGPRLLLVRDDDHARAAELVESHFGLR